MSSGEFDLVYREALYSATNTGFEDPSVQAAHDQFVDSATQATLDAWTKETPSEVLTELHTKVCDTLHMLHPSQQEFDEADVRTIARVRYLGRRILDTAVEQLRGNEAFMQLEPKDPVSLFDFFQYYYWWAAHKGQDIPDERSRDQDVASPLRLGNWPEGEYTNCLGISIGLAAGSEIYGMPYLYGNEIRNSDSILTDRHETFMSKLHGHIPDFESSSVRKILLSTMHERRDPDELYDNVLFETPPTLQRAPRVRDFHHYLLCEYSDEEAGDQTWFQVDPFDLSFSSLGARRSIDSVVEPFFTAGNEHTVVLNDEHRNIDRFYRQFSTILSDAMRESDSVFRHYNDGQLCKSDKFLNKVFDELEAATTRILSEARGEAPDEDVNEQWLRDDKDLANSLMGHTIITYAPKFPKIRQAVQAAVDKQKGNSSKFDGQLMYDETCRSLAHEMQYDTKLREFMVEKISQVPVLAVTHLYEYALKKVLRVRDCGDANTVMEVADPEFMIGAMYMNHYATWRKDGRINVARYLSRISSSQLLWHAARQDENEVDERINAMGEVIRGLKPRQLHPLVNVASGIPNYS